MSLNRSKFIHLDEEDRITACVVGHAGAGGSYLQIVHQIPMERQGRELAANYVIQECTFVSLPVPGNPLSA